MYEKQPWLLFPEEMHMVNRWYTIQRLGGKLDANYDKNAEFTPETTIKKMEYYKK